MIEYPLNFNSEEEHILHILKNRDYYNKILNMVNVDKVTELASGINNNNSYYKGEFNERVLEENIRERFNEWEIDNNKKMNKMDIRIKNKETGKVIGIECKNKKRLTKEDIDKFKRDKVVNKFEGNVFVSKSKISKVVEKVNYCNLIDNDLYIYSDSNEVIMNYMDIYIRFINDRECEVSNNIMFEELEPLINNHNRQKKELLAQDKMWLKLIRERGNSELLSNHLYIIVRSKCKSGKEPY
jgi:uncharacterized protein YuzE